MDWHDDARSARNFCPCSMVNTGCGVTPYSVADQTADAILGVACQVPNGGRCRRTGEEVGGYIFFEERGQFIVGDFGGSPLG